MKRSSAAWVFGGLVFATVLLGEGAALAAQRPPLNLVEMSLEELLTIEITSAGKKEQRIRDTAAAIYVITAEDIRRSQATTLPDLLRQVPGLFVAQGGTGDWAISIRGFNDNRANKLLVLMDGRTLYTPLYTGVDWEIQDTLLQDIDRIEIIRGPGASVWGANAVNGVINIITKDARDTHGGSLTSDVGTHEHGTVAARYGGSLGSDQIHYRLFSKYFSRPSLGNAAATAPFGGWNSVRQGGRLDWAPTRRDEVSVTGEWSLTTVRESDDEITSLTPPFTSFVEEHDRTRAGFVTTRWHRQQTERSDVDVRFFIDRYHQFEQRGYDRDESVGTIDVEVQQHVLGRGQHDLVWGGGFRQVRDHVKPALDSWFSPDRRTARTYNTFVQDELRFLDGTVRVTGGSKFEWNSFSGAEAQPTARLLWNATTAHTVWTSVSRAVRVPSREDVERQSIGRIRLSQNGELSYRLTAGTRAFRPETLIAHEAGYRFVPSTRFSLDAVSFYNRYDHLRTRETGRAVVTDAPIAGVMTPRTNANNGFGGVYGAEIVAFWTVTDAFQLAGNYTFLGMQMHTKPGSTYRADDYEDDHAKNSFYLRSYSDLPGNLEVNADLRFVGRIPDDDVPAYLDANIHLSRPVRRGLRLGFTLENLLHDRRPEWDAEEGVVSRSARARVEWRF